MKASPGLVVPKFIFLGEPIVSNVDAEMPDKFRLLIESIISSALPFVASKEASERSSVVITLSGSILIGVLCLTLLPRSSSSEEISITKS